MFADGLQVGEDLAGVHQVGQPIDDRDCAEPGQVEHVLVGEGADHDSVKIPRHDSGRVFDGFAAAKLDIVAGQEEGMPAELDHADFKRDAGPGRGLAKIIPRVLPAQDRQLAVCFGVGFEPVARSSRSRISSLVGSLRLIRCFMRI